ncbi:MAG: phosphoribosylformylglycinamidine synthase subunit PurQ [Candidatus Wallbacteria bacterium]|nr:phosphoribosylformylglycinamidine synthase subunit PurQ [Candidatus Wallbacteria bacterium]
MKPRAAILLFPGSNCERDAFYGLEQTGFDPCFLWHKESRLDPEIRLVIVPGGFSFGDYLRCGSIASHSPVMSAVRKFADNGGLVLGICNGFQILTESGLLPGALLINRTLNFRCHDVFLRCDNTSTPFTSAIGGPLKMPIAHYEGNYQVSGEELADMERNSQIAFRYCGPDGVYAEGCNPNGSTADIAGIFNKQKNVLGMMPHPERAVENLLGSTAGREIFASLLSSLEQSAAGGMN